MNIIQFIYFLELLYSTYYFLNTIIVQLLVLVCLQPYQTHEISYSL